MIVGLYLLFSILVGVLAIGRGGGFFLYFILAIALSPIISLIILIMATPVVVDLNGDVVKRRRFGRARLAQSGPPASTGIESGAPRV
jgi:hypothetical protein